MKVPQSGAARKAAEALYDRSILIEEREGPPLIRGAIWFGASALALFILWASFAALEEIEVAPGEIVPAQQLVRVQHHAGGIVVEVAVREGSPVREGQLLIKTDPEDSRAQRQQYDTQLGSLLAQAERLRALAEGVSPLFESLPAGAQEFAAGQRELYFASRSQTGIALGILEAQIEQAELEVARAEERRRGLERRIAISEEERAIVAELYARGAVTRAELLAKEKAKEELAEEAASLAAEARRSQAKAIETRAKANEYRASLSKQYKTELASVNERVAQVRASIDRLASSARRLDLIAPVSGVVQSMSYRVPGAVIPAGAAVLEIVPSGEKPRAVARLDPRSAGSVRPGLKARIKVSAFPYDRYGAFTGVVSEISPSTFSDAQGRTYYRCTLEIEGRELGGSETLELLPGMTLSAELATGSKTLLQYLLKPIFASARESFREK